MPIIMNSPDSYYYYLNNLMLLLSVMTNVLKKNKLIESYMIDTIKETLKYNLLVSGLCSSMRSNRHK